MPYGLQIKNPLTGQIILRVTDRITRIGGVIDTGTSDGSFYIPDAIVGTPFFCMQSPTSGLDSRVWPKPVLSGRTISWTFGSPSGRTSARIIYGVY